jgi:single-strand DNA-binding protein
MNRVLLCGRLGQDPEVRFIGSGKAVCTLSLATDERWTDGTGAKQQRTEWHRVEVWGKQAEACGQYLAKGRQVLVEGALRTRTYEKNGETRSVTEVVA